MPPRLFFSACRAHPVVPRLCIRTQRFHTTPTQRTSVEDLTRKTHYQRLNVPTDASPATIKKSFYALSKAHHPDTNPSPSAASLFALLSESYTVLSNATRRASYDRDTLRLQPARGGSYSSTQSPAGGRPASGLSKRRGSFRGPPPSFYRSGGWGDRTEKRRTAHETSTGGEGANAEQQHRQHTEADSGLGGMGPGSNPFKDAEYVRSTPHFDKESHTKTHKAEDRRRWERRRRAVDEDGVEFEPQASLGAHFLIVAGILGATIVAPMVYLQFLRLERHKREA
ncbi:hypothetical protein VHEMI09809 [[Torrubiella] hemipterigena]|uniref:J domain-containing protein n=1 Tax=[Torrubiella] hemipterigena TaxID=1531966 RepID=A0A0A1TR16_9HYPO|nr:hypothetical protein VHEMI09809 [[Torrubiella] hemipterigena]